MRSRAQPKYACGVFGSKGSVYNDCEKVVNNFSVKSHRKTRLVLEEQKQLSAEGFFELFEGAIDGG
jgi:predicted secreted protein